MCTGNMIKCLVLYGSPRIKGNTYNILKELAVKLNVKNISCKEVYLKNLDIKYCIGCDNCLEKFKCVHKDDFTDMIDDIIESEIIIIGTPVYFGGYTAQLKTFIDRLQIFYNNKQIIKNEKKLVFVSAAAESSERVFEPLIMALRYVKYTLKIKHFEKVLINQCYEAKSIDKLLADCDLDSLVQNLIGNS